MNERAKEKRRAYMRRWYQQNKDKARAYTARYWERKAQEAERAEREVNLDSRDTKHRSG